MLKATPSLPPSYQEGSQFDMKSPRRIIWLNAVGLGLVIFFFWLFSTLIAWLRPGGGAVFQVRFDSWTTLLIQTGAIVLTVVVVLLLHEAVHGLFFWLFARHKPTFGIGLTYAYAAMPGWFFPRNQFMLVGAAPFVLLTMVGLSFALVLPVQLLGLLLLAMVMNAAGAVGDLAVLAWLLTKPTSALVCDEGHRIILYQRNL